MALPESHAPDEEWAEERVKRLMEPEPAAAVPKPGEKIAATEEQTATSPVTEVDLSDNPSSDDGVDALIEGKKSDPQAVVADKANDAAVDDILKKEGDEALVAQDKAAQENVVMKASLWEKLKNDWSDWWDDPRKRYGTIAAFLILLGAVFSFPASRAYVMSLVGFRGTISVQVVDEKASIALKGATVSIGDKSVKTDASGKATLTDLRLGDQKLQISKTAFASVDEKIWVKTGSHSLSKVELKPTGTQYHLTFIDYVTKKPISGVEVENGSASALSNGSGKAVLTVLPTASETIDLKVSAEGYRTDTVVFKTDAKTTTEVVLVPAGKSAFVSKQTGTYDLYTIDLDGKNRKVILKGTGRENPNMSLLVSPDGTKVAFVSTRDDQKNKQGYLLSALTIVDISSGNAKTIEHAESVTLIGWSGSKLAYGQTVAGTSAGNAARQRISSYDAATDKKLQLASANYFNGTELIGASLFYAVAANDVGVAPGFLKINLDGTAKKTVLNEEVWTVLRSAYDTVSIQTNKGWSSYTVSTGALKASAAPGSYFERYYVDNDAGKSLWVDNRDGKGVLLLYGVKDGKDTTIATKTGLTNPVRWLSDTVAVYRVVSPAETADYVVGTSAGSTAYKITDVTATSGATTVR